MEEVILPVSAPTDYDGELWISPRILIRHPNYLNEESTGYGGTYWFDDIEVRRSALIVLNTK